MGPVRARRHWSRRDPFEPSGIPTLADAVLDRVVHNAYRIELSGESLRKRKAAEPVT